MFLKFCFNFPINNITNFFGNKTISEDKFVKILPYFQWPFVSKINGKLCGVLTKIIVELSMKYGYRFSLKLFYS
jgi:hypothetical protein